MTLDRYSLERIKTLPFLKKNLEGTNTLCSNLFDFFHSTEKGIFYTFLTNSKILNDQLYQFEHGGVAKGAKDSQRNLVLTYLQNNRGSIAIFDDVNSTYVEPCEDPLFSELEVHYNAEVYYLLKESKLSKGVIEKCFYASNSIWHSLCVVSHATISIGNDKFIQKKDLEKIVEFAEIILIGAYDDESYIIWENSTTPNSL